MSPFLDENAPKTIVCTLNTANPSVVHLIRSYRSRSGHLAGCTILDIACACIASPVTFVPVTIGTGRKQATLIDATSGFANPSQELLREALRVFGGDEEVGTLVSIGAGKGDVWSLSDGPGGIERLEALQRIMANCEPVHKELSGRLRETGIYCRLNLERGMGSQMQMTSEHIAAYLQEEEISNKLDSAIESLQRRVKGVKLRDINSVTLVEVRLKPRPSLTQNFIGRQDIIEAMRKTHFTHRSSESGIPAITILCGLGGSGKTQISLKFAQEFEKIFPNAPVYFLNAESKASLKADYETLVRSLGIEHRSKSHDDALIWLATRLQNWLLILDSTDDPTLQLFDYIPKCAFGNVIITTRNSNHAALAPNSAHHVEGLSEPDSVSLILQSSSYETTEANRAIAREIVRDLGNLPLALAQAAGYIFVNKCLSSYLDIYRKSRIKILASSPSQRLEDYKSSVATTIQMSLGRLPQACQDVMRLFAHLDPTFIAHSIISKAAERQFEHVTWTKKSDFNPRTLDHAKVLREIFCNGEPWSDFEFNELVMQCLQYSLLRLTERDGSRYYSIHVLVQSYLKASSTLVQGHQPCQLVVRFLGSSITYGKDYEYISFNRLLLPHLRLTQLGDIMEAGDHFAFGCVLHETGDWRLATAHWERSVDIWETSLGDEHDNTLRAKTDLALVYNKLGRRQEALELEEQVLALSRKLLGPEHPDTLKATHYLAWFYSKVGRHEEAIEMEKYVLEIRKRILGPEDPETIRIMNSLAASYLGAGSIQLAMKLWEQVLEMRRKVQGPEHPDTLMAMYNLAISYAEAERVEEAVELEEQVIALRTRVLGLEHPDTLDATWNLFCSLRQLGLKEKQVDLLRSGLPVYERVWGESDATFIYAREQLKILEQEVAGRANSA